MAPRRKRRRLIHVKNSSLFSINADGSRIDLSCCRNADLNKADSQTRKLQKKQIILPEQIEEKLKLLGLEDDKIYSKDAQLRGILNHLKDSKIGTYIKCCVCYTWFFLSDVKDVLQIPDFVTCSSPTIKRQTIQRLGKTWIPEPDEFEELIFSCGSVVWAKQGKFVMWPGMIDFCPDNNTFSWTDKESENGVDVPEWYNVVFFSGSVKSKVTRGWIKAENIKPFSPSKTEEFVAPKKLADKAKYEVAMKTAIKAFRLRAQDRLNRFSFVEQFDGVFGNRLQKNKNKKSKLHWRKRQKQNSSLEKEVAVTDEWIENNDKDEESVKEKEEDIAIIADDTPSICDDISNDNLVNKMCEVIQNQSSPPTESKITPMEEHADNRLCHHIDDNEMGDNIKDNSLPIITSSQSIANAMDVSDVIISSEDTEESSPTHLNYYRTVTVCGRSTDQNSTSKLISNAIEPKHIAPRSENNDTSEKFLDNSMVVDKPKSPMISQTYESNNLPIPTLTNAVLTNLNPKCDILPTDQANTIPASDTTSLRINEGIAFKLRENSNIYPKVNDTKPFISVKNWSKCDRNVENINENTNVLVDYGMKPSLFVENNIQTSNIVPCVMMPNKSITPDLETKWDLITSASASNPIFDLQKIENIARKLNDVSSVTTTLSLTSSIHPVIPAAEHTYQSTKIDQSDSHEDSVTSLPSFSKPPLTANMLVMLAIQNEPRLGSKSGLEPSLLSKSSIIKFLQYHFPFFATQMAVKREYAKKIVVEVLKNVGDEGHICIQFQDLQEFYTPLRVACDEKYEEILNSMRCPYLLEFFLLNCQTKPGFFRKPPFSYLALVDVAISYLAKLYPETRWIDSEEIVTFIQAVFPFYSQKAGPFGRVSFEPRANTFGEEIRQYIDKNLNTSKCQTDASKNPDSRGARRITYDVLDGKVRYTPKPERMRELAKNLWKMQNLQYCILGKTIQHLMNTFPELSNLIKENENSNSTAFYQKNIQDVQKGKKSNGPTLKDETMEEIVDKKQFLPTSSKETAVQHKKRKIGLISTAAKKKNKGTVNARTASFSSTSSSSSRPSVHSESRKNENEDKEYEYVNHIESYDLTYEEDDQESIDQLEATLMDESLIELTNTIR